ncbi:MAG: adenosylcobinamide-phosphate synthase [Candidatus Methanomethylophilaceae archaeon]|nr:adenosylcobinamide-phosphate synthase [Candidatus Methanomethylophilaceae archaeon]
MDPLLPAAAVITALFIDLIFGDPPNSIHPLRWIGNVIDALDRRIVRRGPWHDRLLGALVYLFIAAIAITAALLLAAVARTFVGEWAWVIVTALLFKLTFAVSSFRRHCIPIRNALEKGDLDSARSMVSMIVSRNSSSMGKEHLASCCVESVSENSVDSVVSPAFYMGFFGLLGAYLFRCANLMDAMWGYRNDRYRHLGTFPAVLDDILGFISSRISLLFLALAAILLRLDVRGLFRIAARDSSLTPSPNSGWPMAATAGALGISMEKPNVYRIGDGPLPDDEDIEKVLRLVEITSILFIILVTLPSYVFIGAPLQLFLEDALLGAIGGLI